MKLTGYKLPATSNISNLMKHQSDLKKFIFTDNSYAFNVEDKSLFAGVDVSYTVVDGVTCGYCVVAVVDIFGDLVEQSEYVTDVTFPYISGLLSYRELPLILKAVSMLKCSPDVFLFDGNGVLHERGVGLASHASMHLGVPCIGVAKSMLNSDCFISCLPNSDYGLDYVNANNKFFGVIADILDVKTMLVARDVVGKIVKVPYSKVPVFISCGNYIDIRTAVDVVLFLGREREKFPLYIADKCCRELNYTINRLG